MVVVPQVPKTPDDKQVQVVPPSGWRVSQWNDVILLSRCSHLFLLGPLSSRWLLSRDDPLRVDVVTIPELIVKTIVPCRLCLFSLI